MTHAPTQDSSAQRPLRLWPAAALLALMIAIWFGLPAFAPDQEMYGVLGGVACGLLIVIWWLFLSRAPWKERLMVIGAAAVAMVVTRFLLHPSIAGAGQGLLFYVFSLPIIGALVAMVALIGSRYFPRRRAVVMCALTAAAVAGWTLIRTDGVSSSVQQMHWRWTPTAEERLLAQMASQPQPAAPAPAAPAPAVTGTPVSAPAPTASDETSTAAPASDNTAMASAAAASSAPVAAWPGFRGANRDSVVRGVRINTDWTNVRPVELWRKPVGPGWSSFAVQGNLIYTQEQRGQEELVSAYRIDTGDLVWKHSDAVRFYESNGGAGPRATPTLSGGRVYTLGATGIVNALDGSTGARVWTRNAGTDASRAVPIWGFSGSPIVKGDLVIVAAAGTLVAYDRANGDLRWKGPSGGGYSSPHLMTIDGVEQVVLLSGFGARGYAIGDGTVLWEHAWEGAPIVQPALVGGDVLVTSADMSGGLAVKRLDVTRGAGGWQVNELWSSRGLKPYFNDYVVHNGHAYGFDGAILSCIDLATGERKWKGGRYGNGQMVLVADQDVLLVLSEDGELALVGATPDKYTELAKMPALNAKTWNHPVLAGDRLLIRNGEEMVAYRLARLGS